MANWDLLPLQRDLRRLRTPVLLIVGSNDRSIPPAEGGRIARLVPGAKVMVMQGLGHLAHEEKPEETAAAIERFAHSTGVLVTA
jgi:magnesium chelatase accessory protein